MKQTIALTADASQERKDQIAQLTSELIALLNTRDRSGYGPSVVIDALLNTYFAAAESFGMLEAATEVARLNAEAIALLKGLRPADPAMH